MSLIRSMLAPSHQRADGGWSGFADFGDMVGWLGGNGFPLLNQTWATNKEVIEGDFAGLVHGAYQSNGVVFACLMTRFMLFAEARFAFQQMRGGRPGDLFGTPDLGIIERPEPGMTTGDLLTAGMLDADLAGDWFGIRRPGRIKRLRPDWTSVIVGSRNPATEYPGSDPDAEVVGYSYSPNGVFGSEFWSFGPDEIAHFMPIRDPLARYRGMPLPTAVLREIAGDSAATAHKRSFFENAAPQPLDARVLTPAGWTTMGSMEVGDRVIGRDGQPHEVLGVYPQGKRDIYRVTFSDGAVTECTADHLWEVASAYDRKRGVTRSLSLAQIMKKGPTYRSGPHRWSIPLPEPIAFDDPGPLPMDPYLLGVLLGDGSFRNGTVTFSTADPEIVDSVRALVPAGVEVVHQKEYSYHLRAGARGTRSHPMVTLAKSLGLWNVIGYEKAVPEPYLRASVFDREALLQGLIDTDGHVTGSTVRFTNTSEVLTRQIVELVRSLGGRATLAPANRAPRLNHRPQWVANISRLPDWIVPCRLSRKVAAYRVPANRSPRHRYIVAIEQAGRKFAQCIYVDVADHLYVTDDYIVTHNTPNLIVKFPSTMAKPKAQEAIDLFEQEHTGAYNAYRTMYLLGGAEAQAVGKDLQQMDFASVQGKGETRIAAAMNVHPVIVGLSEGLQGSSLNAGNFGAARRLHADKMLRPAWRNFAGSLETIVPPLPGSRLWYDERDVPFLREDIKDAADVLSIEATAMRTLGDGGWEHDAVVDAVTSGDLRRLAGAHTGMVPVQLQQPGSSAVAAQRDFMPMSGAWVGSEIRRGDLLGNDHPLVAAFPSLFAPAAEYDSRAVRVWSPPVRELAASVEVTPAPSTMDLLARALDILAARPPSPAPVVNNYLPASPDVSVSSSPVTFERGAIEVGVQPPSLTMADGAIRFESGPVNVAPSEVHFAEGAFRSEVNVEPPSLTISEGAVQVSVEPAAVSVPVTVEAPQTHIAEGAVQVSVAAPSVTVEAAEVNVPPVTIEAGAVQVTVEAAEPPPPAPPRTVRKTVKRDAAGRITEMTETEETD